MVKLSVLRWDRLRRNRFRLLGEAEAQMWKYGTYTGMYIHRQTEQKE